MAKKYMQLGKILKKLLFEKGLRPADLSRELNIPPPTLHRLVTGKSTRPYQSSLKPIADYFSISLDQLLGEVPLSGRVEDLSIRTVPQEILLIPLELAGKDISTEQQAAFKKLPAAHDMNPRSFAIELNNSSMEPIFSRDSILIFDPDKIPQDRSFVLVKLHNAEQSVFRELLIDADHQYLKSLNSDLNSFPVRILERQDQILGTLVESRKNFNPA